MQMALSLGWHIIFACFGVAFALRTVFTEWRGHRRGDAALTDLAHTWAKGMGVLFAAGAVSGTLLSFEMGILWPGLLDRFGEVYGFPFVLEGFAFFIETIFVGIYLFGWNRLSPRAHMLSAVPMIIAGMAGAFFVVTANAWMNNPTGFALDAEGRVVDADPWAAMFGRRRGRRSCTCSWPPTWSPGSPSPPSTRSGCCAAAATATAAPACSSR
jgi:cytochrome d ubiquinol oxidase subunit I